jgi:hypothetical protein
MEEESRINSQLRDLGEFIAAERHAIPVRPCYLLVLLYDGVGAVGLPECRFLAVKRFIQIDEHQPLVIRLFRECLAELPSDGHSRRAAGPTNCAIMIQTSSLNRRPTPRSAHTKEEMS